MSGRLSGVQARIRDMHKCALYIHCHGHRLNLVIVDVARQVKFAGEFFSLVELLYVFLTRHKVHEVFLAVQREQGVAVRELGKLSDTRWACRHRNISVIAERYDIIIDVLARVQEINDSEIMVQARGLIGQLCSLEFIVNVVLFSKILSLAHGLSEALQSSTLEILQCNRLIAALIRTFSDMRDNPSCWQELWDTVKSICLRNDVAIELSRRGRNKPKLRDVDDVAEHLPTGQRSHTSRLRAL